VTIRRVVVAVTDSPASLRAAMLAIELAEGWHADVRAIHVAEDHTVAALVGAAETRPAPGEAMLRHVATTAAARGVPVETTVVAGEPFRKILEEARSWQADLIVVGGSDAGERPRPHVGQVTERVLDFAECPVPMGPAAPLSARPA
jgi:nucleotide-binding universal stress UspA family protein